MKMKVFITLIGWLILLGCTGKILPSEAFVVSLKAAHISQAQATEAIDKFLQANKYNFLGQNAYDKYTHGMNFLTYGGPDDIDVVIALDEDGKLLLRVNQDAEILDSKATQFYGKLRKFCEQSWPGAISDSP